MASEKASFFRLQKNGSKQFVLVFYVFFLLRFGAPGRPKIIELIFSLGVVVRSVPRVVFGQLLAPFWCHFGVICCVFFELFCSISESCFHVESPCCSLVFSLLALFLCDSLYDVLSNTPAEDHSSIQHSFETIAQQPFFFLVVFSR